ncbi:MAG: peptidoglycan DD-metalloendopeptidase family protein [Orrella sp.]
MLAPLKLYKQSRTICLALIFVALLFGVAQANPADSIATVRQQLDQRVPGGVAVIALGQFQDQPNVLFQNTPVLTIADDNQQWWAVVGLALDTPVGAHFLEVVRESTSESPRRVTFNVANKTYRSQHIRLKNKAMVSPNPSTLARIKEELDIQINGYQTFTATTPSNLLFDAPVSGQLSSPFGLRRYFNGEPRNPHSGLDFAAPSGTPVKAPADGRVLLIGNFYFNGQTIFLDHGQGLITMFCHLSEIAHLPGDRVKRGQVVGKVGSTGRSTGPHLHWNVSLNNARVNPALFLKAR